jgi:hypothetical protein
VSALYLYGMTRPRQLPRRVADQGVFLVESEDRAAIVSKFDDPGAPVRATRRNLLAHADIVEELHSEAVVLPARFGLVLEGPDRARELLGLPEIGELLDRHATTCELTLKGTYDEAVLGEISGSLRGLQDAYRQAPTMDNGVAFGEAVAGALADRRAQDANRVIERIAPLALEIVRGEPTGELGAFGLSLLLERDRVDAVSKMLDQLAGDLSPPLRFKLVGPLPPYSFVQLELPMVA